MGVMQSLKGQMGQNWYESKKLHGGYHEKLQRSLFQFFFFKVREKINGTVIISVSAVVPQHGV